MADTFGAGDLIAPLGEVLDRLDGKISLEDAAALVASFAQARVRQVRPGDLITSRAFNQMIVDLEELRRRVTRLEGTATAPTLTRIDPSPIARVGMLVTLLGSGFDPLTSAERIVVQMGEVEVGTFTLGSGPGVLKLIVPDGFGALPRNVSVRVSVGAKMSNALPLTIQPRAEADQGGEAVVTLVRSDNDPPGNIVAGSRLLYAWTVDGRTVRAADYRFDLDISNPVGASEADWRAGLEIEPAAARIQIGEPQTVTVTVKVPEGARSARLALGVTTDGAIAVRRPAPIEVRVGRPPDRSDPRVRIGFDSGSATADLVKKIAFEGQQIDGLKVPRGGPETQVVLLMEPLQDETGASGAGAYTFEAEFEGAPDGWKTRVSPRTAANVQLGASRQLTVTIQNTEVAGAGTVRMLRVWARRRADAGETTELSAFHRFPVQAEE